MMRTMLNWLTQNVNWIIPLSITALLALQNNSIMRSQKKHQETQICIDLMEKRLRIYYAYLDMVEAMAAVGTSDPDVFTEFREKTKEIKFLFGDDIQQLHKEFNQAVKDYTPISNELMKIWDNNSDSLYQRELAEKEAIALGKITSIVMQYEGRFARYLDFSKYHVK